DLRLERVRPPVAVEARQERVLVDHLLDEPPPELLREAPGQRRLADADHALDRHVPRRRRRRLRRRLGPRRLGRVHLAQEPLVSMVDAPDRIAGLSAARIAACNTGPAVTRPRTIGAISRRPDQSISGAI